MISVPLGLSQKIPFVQKHKESAICAILREKTPFWGIPRGSKRCCYLRNLSAQGCALSNNNANPSGLSEKKSLLCRKSAILSIRWEKPHFGAFPEAQKANWRSQLHAQSSQMHSIPLGPSKKIPFVQKHKESAICAILREKTPFWSTPRGSKRCCYLRNLSAQGCALSQ